MLALCCGAMSLSAHVWDELAILARPNKDGTFTLEKYSSLQPTTDTNESIHLSRSGIYIVKAGSFAEKIAR